MKRFRVQVDGFRACRPLIVCERGSAGSVGSTVSAGKVRRKKIMKRRGVLIAFRAVVISSVAEKSLLQNAHCLM